MQAGPIKKYAFCNWKAFEFKKKASCHAGSLFYLRFDFFQKFQIYALFADLDDFDFHHIADIQNVFHLVDALVAHLGNVDHAVLAGSKFDERAHLGEHADDRTDEHIAHFGIARDGKNNRFGALRVVGIFAV